MVARLDFHPDPANPGWYIRPASKTGRYLDVFGEIRLFAEGPERGLMRVTPVFAHLNILDTVHGGFILSLVDQALFLGPAIAGVEGAIGGKTIEASSQFLAPVLIDQPVDIHVDVLRVTGRMIFARGLMEQGGQPLVNFSGTVKRNLPRS